MSFVPLTPEDRADMLGSLGLSNTDELFEVIPEEVRFPGLSLPKGLSESALFAKARALAGKNKEFCDENWFLGAGMERHYVPSVIHHLTSRGEFLTAYTPYQAEVSQGTLQAIFEYQSHIAGLFAMDVVNASHYDGATALAEAAILSARAARKSRIFLYEGFHPEYIDVLKTYLTGTDISLVFQSQGAAPEGAGACLFPYPAFTGELGDIAKASAEAKGAGASFVVHTHPFTAALFKPPGLYGADAVTAEGQPLGIHPSFGGPSLGIMAVTNKLMRKIPGRLVGQTSDSGGQRGCVLTLSAREQHIRREKAASNICSNQGLMALTAGIYLSALGKEGLRDIARLSYDKAHYAASALAGIDGVSLATKGPFFHEFVITLPVEAEKTLNALKEQGIMGGFPLGRFFPERARDLLVTVTETNTKEGIDRFTDALKGALS